MLNLLVFFSFYSTCILLILRVDKYVTGHTVIKAGIFRLLKKTVIFWVFCFFVCFFLLFIHMKNALILYWPI